MAYCAHVLLWPLSYGTLYAYPPVAPQLWNFVRIPSCGPPSYGTLYAYPPVVPQLWNFVRIPSCGPSVMELCTHTLLWPLSYGTSYAIPSCGTSVMELCMHTLPWPISYGTSYAIPSCGTSVNSVPQSIDLEGSDIKLANSLQPRYLS